MLAICAYSAVIMLDCFPTYYAHNYAGIIGSNLATYVETYTILF